MITCRMMDTCWVSHHRQTYNSWQLAADNNGVQTTTEQHLPLKIFTRPQLLRPSPADCAPSRLLAVACRVQELGTSSADPSDEGALLAAALAFCLLLSLLPAALAPVDDQ